jgi:hypothetical protein
MSTASAPAPGIFRVLACFAPLLAPHPQLGPAAGGGFPVERVGGEVEMYAQTATCNAHRELACFLDVMRPDSI